MKHVVLLISLAAIFVNCRPAAAPVSVSDRPVTINDRPTSSVPQAPAKPMSEMSWTGANDRVQKVGDLKGKAVILDFWATFCPPCLEEIPHLNSLLAKHGADNLQIVGLNVGGPDDRTAIPAFVAKTKMDYPIAFPESDLSQYIFNERDDIPQTLVIDRNGRVITKIVGFNGDIQRQLDAAVEEALKN